VQKLFDEAKELRERTTGQDSRMTWKHLRELSDLRRIVNAASKWCVPRLRTRSAPVSRVHMRRPGCRPCVSRVRVCDCVCACVCACVF
jgi:hypothetical protein